MLIETARYELPPEGITLLGYIVRRMHKTDWLAKVPSALAEGKPAKALEYAAVYAATSSTSFGRAYYQPDFNQVGEILSEAIEDAIRNPPGHNTWGDLCERGLGRLVESDSLGASRQGGLR